MKFEFSELNSFCDQYITQTADCGPGVKCRLRVKCRLQTEIKMQAEVKCRMKTVEFLNICAPSNR